MSNFDKTTLDLDALERINEGAEWRVDRLQVRTLIEKVRKAEAEVEQLVEIWEAYLGHKRGQGDGERTPEFFELLLSEREGMIANRNDQIRAFAKETLRADEAEAALAFAQAANRLVAEHAAMRISQLERVREAADRLDQWLEVQAAVQPTSKKVHDAWSELRAALFPPPRFNNSHVVPGDTEVQARPLDQPLKTRRPKGSAG